MTVEEVKAQSAQGFNCAQIVLMSGAENSGVDPELARRMASGFGSGMGCGEVCGCVTGALMALGLRYGDGLPGEKEKRAAVREKTRLLQQMVKERYGSILCREILSRDGSDKPKKNCAEVMAYVSDCLQQLL